MRCWLNWNQSNFRDGGWTLVKNWCFALAVPIQIWTCRSDFSELNSYAVVANNHIGIIRNEFLACLYDSDLNEEKALSNTLYR